ncbi:MAG: dipeptidase [Rikenellaceae bacterium]
MKKTQIYINENKDKFLTELFELLRIPSISAESAHKGDMVLCANKIKENLLSSGADKATVYPTAGAPVVYGEKTIDAKLPTILIYGHYDVMPVEPIELWKTDPFEPQICDGKIFGRGADDDKGQSFMLIKAFEAMTKTGELCCNVKFMIEGEEEIGSTNLAIWCEANKEMLKADIILIADTSMLGSDTPSVTCGLRGLTYMEVKVTGPNVDLHSGLYGGAVANPANVLANMISKLHTPDGRIAIPNFYDDVRILSKEERDAINAAPFSEDAYRKKLDIESTMGEEGYSTLERTGIRPALDVNGIWGGHITEGSKTVIGSTAHAKISMRLVPNQDYKTIAKLFEKYFISLAPKGVRVEVTPCHGGCPYVTPTSLSAYKAAEKAVLETFGKAPVPFYSGGSIPIVSTFEKVLGIKSILLGFGLESDAIHSPNENYHLDSFYKGIRTMPYFFKYFCEK